MEVQPDFRELLASFNAHRVKYVIQLGVPPVRVDLITSLTGVSWEETAAGKIAGSYGDVPVYYIGQAQLIANKRATGRKRDLADLEALEDE